MHSPNPSQTQTMSANQDYPSVGSNLDVQSMDGNRYENDSMPLFGNDRAFDVAPPGTEPPPPGFENDTVNRYNRDREWSPRTNENDQRTPGRDAVTPDLRDRHLPKDDQNATNEAERRSRSRSVNEHSRNRIIEEKNERKRHSRTPVNRDGSSKTQNRDRHERERDKGRSHNRTGHTKERERIKEPERKEVDKDRRREKFKDRNEEKRKRCESTDDEKRERKSKDKKKKKKEEKSVDKKKKKEKKEKREKDGRKEQSREKKLSSSKENQDSSNDDDSKQNTPTMKRDDTEHEIGSMEIADRGETNSVERSNTPPQRQQQGGINECTESDKPKSTEDFAEGDGSIDLYGDIALEYQTTATAAENQDEDIETATSSPSHLNRSESILDIHANVDFDESYLSETKTDAPKRSQNDTVFAPFPEPSKWEREDDIMTEKKCGDNDTAVSDDRNKVTNEVLKRAENAIFARAINAIRPIEIKKISLERQKLYSNDKSENEPSSISSVVVIDSPKNVLPSFQITVPVNSEAERSVEIKGNAGKQRNKTPTRSIKERLGKKITEDSHTRSKTPLRKVISESGNQMDRPSSRSRDRFSNDRDKYRDNEHRGQGARNDRHDKSGRRSERERSPEKTNRDRRDRDRDSERGREREKIDSRNRDSKENRDRRDHDKKSNTDVRESRPSRENRDIRSSREDRDRKPSRERPTSSGGKRHRSQESNSSDSSSDSSDRKRKKRKHKKQKKVKQAKQKKVKKPKK